MKRLLHWLDTHDPHPVMVILSAIIGVLAIIVTMWGWGELGIVAAILSIGYAISGRR